MDSVILFSHARTRQFLHADQATELLDAAVSTCLESGCFDRVIVLCDMAGYSDGGRSSVSVVHRFDLPNGDSPAEVVGVVATLGDAGSATGSFMVVSPLLPFLEADTLRTAVRTFLEQGEAPLVSVMDPEDHPCQLYSFCRVDGLGLALLLENPVAPGHVPDRVRSRVFPFDWSRRTTDDVGNGSLLAEQFVPEGVRYEPVSADPAFWPEPYVWEKVASDSARIHFAPATLDELAGKGGPEEVLAGVGLDAEKIFGDVLAFRREDGSLRLVSTLRQAYPQGGKASLIPVGGASADAGRTVVIPERGLCEILCSDSDDVRAISYSFMENVEQGPCSVHSPFFQETVLWWHDSNGISHKRETGEVIHGRQMFPDTYAMLPGFVVFLERDVDAVVRGEMEDRIAFSVVPESETLVLDSSDSMVWYKLEKEARLA